MAYEQRDMSGSLFRNDKREKDTHPNLTGTVMIGGVEYWASGWTKERSNGEKWISLSFKPKEQRTNARPNYAGASDDEWNSAAAATRSRFDDDSDAPF